MYKIFSTYPSNNNLESAYQFSQLRCEQKASLTLKHSRRFHRPVYLNDFGANLEYLLRFKNQWEEPKVLKWYLRPFNDIWFSFLKSCNSNALIDGAELPLRLKML